MQQLVIVESPTKAKTISGFLGKGYKVLSSFGHVRDLPKSEFGIDVENDFKPKYIIPMKAKKVVSALKKEAKKSDQIILATDEDREGESISWHLKEALSLEDPKRIVFHEITKSAIENAINNPREIDINLVDSQQARRILDRIVGYKLSPFLWKKVARKLSAGRVQSVAVRLVVEKEREIESFKPDEYWTVEALLKKEKEFTAMLVKKGEENISKLGIKSKEKADEILNNLNESEYKVEKIERKETKRNPLPPFTTSTLQQEAWKKLRFPAKVTMRIAQGLYEQGFITYHRTDSVNLSKDSLSSAKKFIEDSYGKNYWAIRAYKSKGRAQEAHEAIRPTSPSVLPESIKADRSQQRLYDLIWKRFVASQMATAVFDSIAADIKAKEYTFRANGQTLKFDGFLKVYPMNFIEKELPELKENEILELIKLIPSQHFTQPPARFTEASLIKALEENGIGRPSTYAPILSTIQARNYIAKNEEKRFYPTEIGIAVNDVLVEHFPQIVDIGFTAQMEEELDRVAEGKEKWTNICKEFYDPFEKNLEKKYKEVEKTEISVKPTDKTCPKCGAPLIERLGRFGRFYACSKFPECKYTESLKENTLDIKCPKCQEGNLTTKRTKKGKIFYGCNQFPKCDFALWDKPVKDDETNNIKKCPKCDAPLIETKRKEIKCSSKECNFKQKKAD